MFLRAFVLSVCVLFPISLVQAQELTTIPVHFAKGQSSTVLKGQIKGYQYIDYTLNAKAGQRLTVVYTSRQLSSYFNILPPGSSDEAIFVGASAGNAYRGALPASGEYTLRVYIMRNAARPNETAKFTLKVAIDTPPADAKVSGTPYHATGTIPCVVQQSRECQFGVVRQGQGSAEVTIQLAQGQRIIRFDHGTATGYTATPMPHGDFSQQKQKDVSHIKIGAEQYEIPDAVIDGG
ncbi:PPC domain-containing protein [Deefgea sp. CFH1-16]|uniref:PPC domain-containing protein n=1 Tax=Deefgea sp. CFH1-16 TaxID=2675457 RepID=UPI0015F4B979|nr:PPC domain-containing protein [Deefgea sp. CFH1-16]MBM5574353.1 hypothetical protein [Deefgea sp. CFH1-16]